MPSAPLRPLSFVLFLFTLWFICFKHLSAEWTYNEQYNYGWFVPFFALYLFWLRWEDRPLPTPEAPARSQRSEVRGQIEEDGGLKTEDTGSGATQGSDFSISAFQLFSFSAIIAIASLLLLLPIRLIEIANPDWRSISWLHTLAAVTLTLLIIGWIGGRPWLRHFAFPVLFVLVSVPWLSVIEQPIILGLMPTLASIATGALSLFGIPAEVQGNLIQINGGVVGVSEACSGVRSLQTSIMIGLLFGELKRFSVTRRILLIVAAIAIAFVANCGRAFFLVWIAATRGLPEVERWHDIAGYAIVVLVFFGCLGAARLLARRERSAEQRAEDRFQGSGFSVSAFQRFRFSTPIAIGALLWLLVVEAGAEYWYRAHETNLTRNAQWSVRWPQSASQFRNLPIEERTRGILHYDQGRGATWRETGGDSFALPSAEPVSLLYFFRWEPGHNSALLANAHRPDVCLPATGWKQVGDFGVREYPITENFAMPFRHFVFAYENAGRNRYAHAFYCVWEDRVVRASGSSLGEGASDEMSNGPSSWTRNERIEAVLQGRRHLGQQVMEYLLVEPRQIDAKDAEQQFATKVRQLVVPAGTVRRE